MNTVVEALIEIPLHSKNKYEIDPTTGKIKLDRVLYASMVYPTEYGSVENTLAPDGDPLDILVVCDNPSFQVLIRGTFLEGLTLAIRFVVTSFSYVLLRLNPPGKYL